MIKRICITCGKEKPLDEFSANKDSKEGRRRDCKKCHSEKNCMLSDKTRQARKAYMKEYRLRNLEKWNRTPEQQSKINERRRELYATCHELREKLKSNSREFWKNNPLKKKIQRIKKYGLSLDNFMALMEKHDGKCAICGYADTSNKNFFPVIDHCHIRGDIRGILCMNCNMGIGKFKDDANILDKAARYLRGE